MSLLVLVKNEKLNKDIVKKKTNLASSAVRLSNITQVMYSTPSFTLYTNTFKILGDIVVLHNTSFFKREPCQ